MGRLPLAIIAVLLAAGCAAPGAPEHHVRFVQPEIQYVARTIDALTIAEAIDFQRFRDNGLTGRYVTPRWYAVLHNGIWHAWTADDDREGCDRPPLKTKCRAAGLEINQIDGHTREIAYMGDLEY